MLQQDCSDSTICGSLCQRLSHKALNPKVGVLLAQLGTPDAPTAQAVRRYLRGFLGDYRVVRVNRILWWCILNGIILPLRGPRSAKLYWQIWTDRGSPLLVHTKAQSERLQAALGDNVRVEFGMRYGNPPLSDALRKLIDIGCGKIVVFPGYPQYSSATTGSTCELIFKLLSGERWIPSISVVEPCFSHAAYLEALAGTIRKAIESLPFAPERILLSYHGLPRSEILAGDPYCCMCRATTGAIQERLAFPAGQIIHCYQSRFGRSAWLTPATDETLRSLARQGIKRVAVVSPSFIADCLETLQEMGIENKQIFLSEGGTDYALLPCLNDSPEWIGAMAEILRPYLAAVHGPRK